MSTGEKKAKVVKAARRPSPQVAEVLKVLCAEHIAISDAIDHAVHWIAVTAQESLNEAIRMRVNLTTPAGRLATIRDAMQMARNALDDILQEFARKGTKAGPRGQAVAGSKQPRRPKGGGSGRARR